MSTTSLAIQRTNTRNIEEYNTFTPPFVFLASTSPLSDINISSPSSFKENQNKFIEQNLRFTNSVKQKGRINAVEKWCKDEDKRLEIALRKFPNKNWRLIADYVGTRTEVQCMRRWRSITSPEIVKGAWTSEEDRIILDAVESNGIDDIKWSDVAVKLKGRSGKQCRERYLNYLDQNIKRSEWTEEEDILLFELQRVIGNKWAEIAKIIPRRSENNIKNRFNSKAKKKYIENHSESMINNDFYCRIDKGFTLEQFIDNLKISEEKKKEVKEYYEMKSKPRVGTRILKKYGGTLLPNNNYVEMQSQPLPLLPPPPLQQPYYNIEIQTQPQYNVYYNPISYTTTTTTTSPQLDIPLPPPPTILTSSPPSPSPILISTQCVNNENYDDDDQQYAYSNSSYCYYPQQEESQSQQQQSDGSIKYIYDEKNINNNTSSNINFEADPLVQIPSDQLTVKVGSFLSLIDNSNSNNNNNDSFIENDNNIITSSNNLGDINLFNISSPLTLSNSNTMSPLLFSISDTPLEYLSLIE